MQFVKSAGYGADLTQHSDGGSILQGWTHSQFFLILISGSFVFRSFVKIKKIYNWLEVIKLRFLEKILGN